jgi:toxin ParE1/3/4
MGKIVWTEPAAFDLKAIAEYIELDNPKAAKLLVKELFEQVEKLELYPKMGKIPKSIANLSYRELVIPPCRVFYRLEKSTVYIVAVMRQERDSI